MTTRPVIVTRPAREAVQWVDELRAASIDAIALPLIVIAPVDDAEPLHTAWRQLASYAALMFVSATAVENFFLHQGPDAATQAMVGRRFWATGPGTTRALLRAGVPPEAIDAPPRACATRWWLTAACRRRSMTRRASWRSTVPKAERSGSSAAPKPSAICSARCPMPTGMARARW
jgi:hypothetical protein